MEPVEFLTKLVTTTATIRLEKIKAHMRIPTKRYNAPATYIPPPSSCKRPYKIKLELNLANYYHHYICDPLQDSNIWINSVADPCFAWRGDGVVNHKDEVPTYYFGQPPLKNSVEVKKIGPRGKHESLATPSLASWIRYWNLIDWLASVVRTLNYRTAYIRLLLFTAKEHK